LARTILTVDDSLTMLMSIKIVLENAGYQVEQAQNGKSGLTVLDKTANHGRDKFYQGGASKKDLQVYSYYHAYNGSAGCQKGRRAKSRRHGMDRKAL